MELWMAADISSFRLWVFPVIMAQTQSYWRQWDSLHWLQGELDQALPWRTQPRQDKAFHFPTQRKRLWTYQHLGTSLNCSFSFHLPPSHKFREHPVPFRFPHNFHKCISPLILLHLSSKPIHKTLAAALKSGGRFPDLLWHSLVCFLSPWFQVFPLKSFWGQA